jgi:hypothetical protein
LLFCACPDSATASTIADNDVRLSVHRYEGVADPLDALIYASLTYSRSNVASIERDVAISVIAGIALWDPYVTDRLVGEALEIILNPSEVLSEIAHERSWDGSPSWASGSCGRFGETELIHSAILCPRSKELESRIWSAEVGVVFPRIEVLRRKFVDRYAKLFRLPFVTHFGEVINDVRDLEIGQVKEQLQRICSAAEDRQSIEQITRVRNRLAHLELLDSALLQAFRRASCVFE